MDRTYPASMCDFHRARHTWCVASGRRQKFPSPASDAGRLTDGRTGPETLRLLTVREDADPSPPAPTYSFRKHKSTKQYIHVECALLGRGREVLHDRGIVSSLQPLLRRLRSEPVAQALSCALSHQGQCLRWLSSEVVSLPETFWQFSVYSMVQLLVAFACIPTFPGRELNVHVPYKAAPRATRPPVSGDSMPSLKRRPEASPGREGSPSVLSA